MSIRRRRIDGEPGYDSLLSVFVLALEESQHGKGKQRHANNQPFINQDICQITRDVGHGFTRGQAIKKIREAQRLTPKAAEIREILGALNYLAADVIVLIEEAEQDGAPFRAAYTEPHEA